MSNYTLLPNEHHPLKQPLTSRIVEDDVAPITMQEKTPTEEIPTSILAFTLRQA